jgi:hypothetical protein
MKNKNFFSQRSHSGAEWMNFSLQRQITPLMRSFFSWKLKEFQERKATFANSYFLKNAANKRHQGK